MSIETICIVEDTDKSEKSYNSLVNSAVVTLNHFPINRYYKSTKNNLASDFNKFDIEFKWPKNKTEHDINLGIIKNPSNKDYTDIKCRALTHYKLWEYCIESQKTLLILEDCVRFSTKFEYNFDKSPFNIISINHPKHCISNWESYTNYITYGKGLVTPIPQYRPSTNLLTLPDAVSYIIKPAGATQLVLNVDDYGLWPVEKMLAKQMIPNIGVSRKHYTRKVIL